MNTVIQLLYGIVAIEGYFKGRGTLLHGGYVYFFFSFKMEQICTASLMGLQNPL
jgi:hypothetical protein